MPGRITELSETQIIADLLRDRRRMAAAQTLVQVPQPAKDTLTISSNGAPVTWQLTAIPYQGTGGSSLNLSLNGVELLEGVDYTVDYTTAVVTFSAGQQALFKATPTPADVLEADYWTTGDLVAATVPADVGTIVDTFDRADSATTLGTTSDGKATWQVDTETWGISSNQAYKIGTGSTSGRAYINTGVSDCTVQVTVTNGGFRDGGGLVLRWVDTNNWWAARCKPGVNLSQLIWVTSGSAFVAASFTFTIGHVLKAVMSGSTIQIYDATTSTLLATDTQGFFSTATRHGLYVSSLDNAVRLDDFSATQ